jgi:hypothetical protein
MIPDHFSEYDIVWLCPCEVRIHTPPGVVLADGGYWNVPQIEELVMQGNQTTC